MRGDGTGWTMRRRISPIGVRTLLRSPSFTVAAIADPDLRDRARTSRCTRCVSAAHCCARRRSPRSPASGAASVDAEPRGTLDRRCRIRWPSSSSTNSDVLAAVLVESQDQRWHGARQADRAQSTASFVSPNWFDELGYGPLHGRVLSDALDARTPMRRPSCSATPFWKSRLGGDPDTRSAGYAYLDRKAVMVVGIAPKEMPGLDFDVPDRSSYPIAHREYFYPAK